jgi:hypothetical protein
MAGTGTVRDLRPAKGIRRTETAVSARSCHGSVGAGVAVLYAVLELSK